MENQSGIRGKKHSRSQRRFCKECKKYYTLNPKIQKYSEEICRQVIKNFYAGTDGHGVSWIFKFNKANVYNWIKKALQRKSKKETKTDVKIEELDELYWFLARKSQTKRQENVYIITMASRKLRQIMGYMASRDKSSKTIQQIVDMALKIKAYYTDGYDRYLDVIFPRKYVYNIYNKEEVSIGSYFPFSQTPVFCS